MTFKSLTTECNLNSTPISLKYFSFPPIAFATTKVLDNLLFYYVDYLMYIPSQWLKLVHALFPVHVYHLEQWSVLMCGLFVFQLRIS